MLIEIKFIFFKRIKIFNLKGYGGRSFAVSAPTVWNVLPKDIKDSSSMNIF